MKPVNSAVLAVLALCLGFSFPTYAATDEAQLRTLAGLLLLLLLLLLLYKWAYMCEMIFFSNTQFSVP